MVGGGCGQCPGGRRSVLGEEAGSRCDIEVQQGGKYADEVGVGLSKDQEIYRNG